MTTLKLISDNTDTNAGTVSTTLRDQTLAFIKTAIIDGKFSAGQKLVERELCEMTGASRSILREALSNLEARRLIVRVSNRGYSVAKLSPNTIREIFELRQSVETFAAELFTERASEQEIEQIAEAFSKLATAIDNSDLPKVRSAKSEFYNILFSGCRNTEIQLALENVIDRISFLRSILINSAERRKASLIEMQKFCSALTQRDKITARQACLTHLQNAHATLLKQLSNEERSF